MSLEELKARKRKRTKNAEAVKVREVKLEEAFKHKVETQIFDKGAVRTVNRGRKARPDAGRVNVYVELDNYEKIRDFAHKRGCTIGSLVDVAFAKFVEEEGL